MPGTDPNLPKMEPAFAAVFLASNLWHRGWIESITKTSVRAARAVLGRKDRRVP